MIEVADLWKDYGDQTVLESVSMTIAPRAFVALVGPSGCGKTTFLRLLLGAEKASKGTITVDGNPLTPEPGPDRGIVFQRYSVFPHLTVLGNVLLPRELEASPGLARLFGARRRSALADARALLDEVGLSDHETKYPSALSGGMQQRLALAQALMRRPKILLLDEPFGALDPGIRADIHALTRRLWHETELTVIMVTHDLREAFSLATRVVAFERKRDGLDERQRMVRPSRATSRCAETDSRPAAARSASQPHGNTFSHAQSVLPADPIFGAHVVSQTPDTQAAIAANRHRYDELKRAGQTHAPRALPGPNLRPAPPLDADVVLHREVIPGGWYWSTTMLRGEALRLSLAQGPAAVALVAWALPDTSERLNYADTVKVQWTTALGRGRVLFSDMGRVMLSIIADRLRGT